MRPPYLILVTAGLVTGCLQIDRSDQANAWRYHEVCPEGVKIFRSAKDVGQSYDQIGRVDSTDVPGWEDDRPQSDARRRAAGILGANGIIVQDDSKSTRNAVASLVSQEAERRALAIFIPADSDRVRRACVTSRAQLAAMSRRYQHRRASSYPRLTAANGTGISYRSGMILARAKPELPDSATVFKALAADPPAVDEATLARNPEMRWTMATAARVGIATGYYEGHPAFSASWSRILSIRPALPYTLAELWQAYRDHPPLDEPLLLELWIS